MRFSFNEKKSFQFDNIMMLNNITQFSIDKLRKNSLILMMRIKTKYDGLPLDSKKSIWCDNDGFIDIHNLADDDDDASETKGNGNQHKSNDMMWLEPGSFVQYQSKFEGIVESSQVSHIERKRDRVSRDCDYRIMLENGNSLIPGTHLVKVVKIWNSKNEKYVWNHGAGFFPVESYDCLEGKFENDERVYPGHYDTTDEDEDLEFELPGISFEKGNETDEENTDVTEKPKSQSNYNCVKNKCKPRASNPERYSGQGFTTGEKTMRRKTTKRLERKKDEEASLPFFFINLDPKSRNKFLKIINEKYKQALDYGSPHLMKSILESASTKQFKDRQYQFMSNIREQIKKGAIRLNFPDKRQILYIGGNQSNRKRLIEQQMLLFEHKMKCLSIHCCPSCRENVMMSKNSEKLKKAVFAEGVHKNPVCEKCKDKEPNYYIENNLHPVWYEHDKDGNIILDNKGKPIVHYDIPKELSDLTVPEQLLIRRYAPFIPSFHVRNGIFGIQGNCVSFAQDVTEACNVLPRLKDSIVTYIRHVKGNNTTQQCPKQYRINRHRVMKALYWLKRHHEGYKNIKIEPKNIWFDEDEISILDDSTSFIVNKKEENEVERISEAHDRDLGNIEQEEGFEINTMHANKQITVPFGEPSQPIQDFIKIAKETNQKGKFLRFPAISTEPLW